MSEHFDQSQRRQVAALALLAAVVLVVLQAVAGSFGADAGGSTQSTTVAAGATAGVVPVSNCQSQIAGSFDTGNPAPAGGRVLPAMTISAIQICRYGLSPDGGVLVLAAGQVLGEDQTAQLAAILTSIAAGDSGPGPEQCSAQDTSWLLLRLYQPQGAPVVLVYLPDDATPPEADCELLDNGHAIMNAADDPTSMAALRAFVEPLLAAG